ncbi:MAG: precorrin-4 C(11)-methyltransferase [Pseudomonadota bacterium]
MTVHFIGAGPGAADLITIRGRDLIRSCPVILYAGSLVPEALLAEAGDNATVIDTAPLTLDAIIQACEGAHAKGHDVARLHSGDVSLYGAIAEQIRRLTALGIPYTITPGVPAYAAAAAALERELTLPGISQSIVLTRTAVRASAMPEGEDLKAFAATGATLAIHLGINNLVRIVRDLTPILGADMPVAVVYRASWPDQKIIKGTLLDIRDKVKAAGITRTALIVVGHVLEPSEFADSRLYDPTHTHVLRPKNLSTQSKASEIDTTTGSTETAGR